MSCKLFAVEVWEAVGGGKPPKLFASNLNVLGPDASIDVLKTHMEGTVAGMPRDIVRKAAGDPAAPLHVSGRGYHSFNGFTVEADGSLDVDSGQSEEYFDFHTDYEGWRRIQQHGLLSAEVLNQQHHIAKLAKSNPHHVVV